MTQSPALAWTEVAPWLTFGLASLALLAATCAWILMRLDLAAEAAPSPSTARDRRRLGAGVAATCLAVAVAGYGLWGTPAAWQAGPAAEARSVEAWRELARNHADRQAWADAEAALRQAIALSPQDPDLLTDLADVLAIAAGRRMVGEPVRLLAEALRHHPTHVKALALVGIAAFEQGDAAAAVSHWERALAHAEPTSSIAQDLQAALPAARERAAGSSHEAGAETRN
jgi:cytochrome c-type biogenesis protein CcmH